MKTKIEQYLLVTLFVVLSMIAIKTKADTPVVTVSIAPLHSLVAGVMQGVAEPRLLYQATLSPHTTYLKPSQTDILSTSDLVIWVGPNLETGLDRVLKRLDNIDVITLIARDEIDKISLQSFSHYTHATHSNDDESIYVDPHLWLSTGNARAIVKLTSDTMARIDPLNASHYRVNEKTMLDAIEELYNEIMHDIRQLRNTYIKPYIVFHDSYRYFENEFAVKPLAVVTSSPEKSPGLKHMLKLRRMVEEQNVHCVFTEPQFKPDAVTVLIKDTKARHGVLDPVGSSLHTGKQHWFDLMRALKNSLLECLTQS